MNTAHVTQSLCAMLIVLGSGFGFADDRACTTNHLAGRWRVARVVPLAANSLDARNETFETNAALFLGSNGMSVSVNGDRALATCWEISTSSGQPVVVLGRLAETAQFVRREGVNKLHLMPLDKSVDIELIRAESIKPSELSSSLIGTWCLARTASTSPDVVLYTFYPEGVFVIQTPMDMAGGEWTLRKLGKKNILSIDGQSYKLTMDDTNRWRATATIQGEERQLVFERRPPSELGYPQRAK
jgi:hypothetical protein